MAGTPSDTSGAGSVLADLRARLNGSARRPAGDPALAVLRIENDVVYIDGSSSAVGLRWTTAEDGVDVKSAAAIIDGSLSPEAVAAGDTHGLYIDLRRHGFLAFSPPGSGHEIGMRALVTAFPEAVTGPRWMGIFCVSEKSDTWWLGSMRNGQVFEDQVIRGRQKAEDTLLAELEAPDWTAVYAPADWHIPGASDEPLAALYDPRAGQKLKHVRPLKANAPKLIGMAVAAALTLGGLYGWNAWKRHELEMLREMQRQMDARVTLGPADMPWDRLVRVDAFVAACESEIARTVLLVPGWEAQPISCTVEKERGMVSTGWTRAEGRFSWLVAAIPPGWPPPILAEDGDSAAMLRPFEVTGDPQGHADEPWHEIDLARWLRNRFQTVDLEISLRPSQGNRPTADGGPVFNSTDVQVSSGFGLTEHARLLAEVPALIPTALIYGVESGSWDLILKGYHIVLMPTPGI